MGEKLVKYYNYVKNKMGYEGQAKLAMATKMPSTIASVSEDSKENIEKFKKELEKITGEKPPDFD